MYIAINIQTGAAFWRVFGRSYDETLAAAVGKPGAPADSADIALYETNDADLAECALADMVVTIEGGEVTSVEVAPDASLLLEVLITDADGEDPPGIANDGVDSFTAAIALQLPDGSPCPLLDPGTGNPLPEDMRRWRVTVRDDDGAIYDVVKVLLGADGTATLNYTTTGRPARCRLEDRDLALVQVMGYTVRLKQPVEFVVFRVLA